MSPQNVDPISPQLFTQTLQKYYFVTFKEVNNEGQAQVRILRVSDPDTKELMGELRLVAASRTNACIAPEDLQEKLDVIGVEMDDFLKKYRTVL